MVISIFYEMDGLATEQDNFQPKTMRTRFVFKGGRNIMCFSQLLDGVVLISIYLYLIYLVHWGGLVG